VVSGIVLPGNFDKEWGYDKNTGVGKRITGPGLLQDNRERGYANPASL